MTGTLGGLFTSLSALYAQRRGLEVTGQNIANVNTEGYARQRLHLVAVGAPASPSVLAVGDPAGGGVAISEVTRMRDEFLEARARAERASEASVVQKKEIYTRIEQVVGEPSDTGIQKQMSDFWAAWHGLVNRTGDAAARTQLIELGDTLSASIVNAFNGIGSLWTSTREQLDTYVDEVNAEAATVAQLNDGVMRATQAGLPGDELADQRDQAVMRLCEMTGGSAFAGESGAVNVTIFGSSLVFGHDHRELYAYGATAMVDRYTDPDDPEDPAPAVGQIGLRWKDTHGNAVVPAGKMAATVEALNTTLTGVATSLDDVARELARSVNEEHSKGYGLYDADGFRSENQDFFVTPDAADTSFGAHARSIAVAIVRPEDVAASQESGNELDGKTADAIAGLATLTSGADGLYRQFVVDLGVHAQTVYRQADIQHAISEDVDAARTSYSGVNLDEEMTNLIAYQRAYQAAAKVMSTIDQAIDSLITLLGR